jgi:hypothetical protein
LSHIGGHNSSCAANPVAVMVVGIGFIVTPMREVEEAEVMSVLV